MTAREALAHAEANPVRDRGKQWVRVDRLRRLAEAEDRAALARLTGHLLPVEKR